jgi:hypothetical protein
VFAATAAFFLADDAQFVGYSRFNLMLAAPLFSCVVLTVRSLDRQRWAAAVAALLVLAGNAYYSPVYADGSKRPGWGSPRVDTAEHYYPYRAALTWVAETHRDAAVCFAGMDYPYYAGFYFAKLEWYPRHVLNQEGLGLAGALRVAAEADCPVLVYQPRGVSPAATAKAGFALSKTFENRAHKLHVYVRARDVVEE